MRTVISKLSFFCTLFKFQILEISQFSVVHDFEQNTKLLGYDILEKGRQCHITKQLIQSFSVNIRISQPSNSVTQWTSLSRVNKSDFSLKRMHQLYFVSLFVIL